MTDTLRDKIAAVLRSNFPNSVISDHTSLQMADSVIAFLDEQLIAALMLDMGLRTEWGLLDHTDSGLICDTLEDADARKPLTGERLCSRLVTDWINVETG